MSGRDHHERCQGRPGEAGEVIVRVEVRVAEGVDARELALEQARVIREVIEWVARSRSDPERRDAA